ncbi:hypothetical protein B0H16DRAFT_1703990, partial [Mycena metata]
MTALPLELQLSQLSLLPPLFRLSAKSAAAGSSKALERIPYLIADCTDLHTPRLVLPTLFAVLQRAPVPTTDELDTESLGSIAENISKVYTAIRCLKGLHDVPSHIVIYMWPLVWAWIHFITLHPSCFPYPAPAEDILCYELATVVSSLYVGHSHEKLAVPGIKLVSDSAVRAVVQATAAARSPCFCLRSTSKGGSTARVERSGTLHPSFVNSLHAELIYHGAIVTIDQLWRLNDGLALTLLKCGLVGGLTKMLHALLTETIDFDIEFLLRSTLVVLLALLTSTPIGERWMVDALKVRLLPALMSISQRALPYCTEKLFLAVTTSLVHYRVVAQRESYMPEMTSILRTMLANNERDKMPEGAKLFGPICMQRMKLWRLYEDGHCVSSQACDNMKACIASLSEK